MSFKPSSKFYILIYSLTIVLVVWFAVPIIKEAINYIFRTRSWSELGKSSPLTESVLNKWGLLRLEYIISN